MIMTVRDRNYLLDIMYGPVSITPSFYDAVLFAYECLVIKRQFTPFLEELEEWLFKKAYYQMNGSYPEQLMQDHQYAIAFMEQDINKDLLKEYTTLHGDEVRRDLKICLRHARLTFLDAEFITPQGNSIVARNSAQIKLFKVYDIYGNSD